MVDKHEDDKTKRCYKSKCVMRKSVRLIETCQTCVMCILRFIIKNNHRNSNLDVLRVRICRPPSLWFTSSGFGCPDSLSCKTQADQYFTFPVYFCI